MISPSPPIPNLPVTNLLNEMMFKTGGILFSSVNHHKIISSTMIFGKMNNHEGELG